MRKLLIWLAALCLCLGAASAETADRARQTGAPASYSYHGELFNGQITYPVLGIKGIDAQIQSFGQKTLSEALLGAKTANAARALSVDYDVYALSTRYIGVAMTGEQTDADGHVINDVVFTLNADAQTGALLEFSALYDAKTLPDVLLLLHAALKAAYPQAFEANAYTPDEGWLAHTVITDKGVDVLLPRGRFLPEECGTARVSLPNAYIAPYLLINTGYVAPKGEPTAAPTKAPEATVTQSGRVIDPTKPMIALTFDDGPNGMTPKFLKLLSDNGGVATFFMIGKQLKDYPNAIQQVIDQGSEIGCHTWDHVRLDGATADKLKRQITYASKQFEKYGVTPKVFRPPYGNQDKYVRRYCKENGMAVVNWSIDTKDWATKSANRTYNNIMNNVKDGSIILCHEIYTQTYDAMERVIPELVRRGYQLVTVSELLSYCEGGMVPGQLYTHKNEAEQFQ